MKIGIDISQMCYEGTGVARYVRGLATALLTTASPHSFTLIAGARKQRDFFTRLHQSSPWDQAQLKLYGLPPKLAGLLLNTLPIPYEWLVGKYDVLHTSDWVQPVSRVPMVTTVHDLVFKKYPETVEPLIRRVQELRLARLANSSTMIIADSKSTKDDLVEIFSVDPMRVQVIYPGIDAQWRPVSEKEIVRVKTKYKLPTQFILSVGTQEPRKNLTRLVEASHIASVPLVLVGRHGWGKETQTLGYVPDEDLPALYSAASVFAYPSLYEGFGFPVLEAMACGTPVVTSNVSSLPEVGGKAAVQVDPTDTGAIAAGIAKAINERDMRISLGFTQAKLFRWEKTAKQVLEVYEKTSDRH